MKRVPSKTTRKSPRPSCVHQFLIVLANTDPLGWRRIQVPEYYSFWDLHVAIQDAMGWSDSHLHEFLAIVDSADTRVERFGIPGDEFLDERPTRAGWTVRLSSVIGRGDLPMVYLYDFGDDWRHLVMYEGPALIERRTTYPRCLSGARKCPPEDCGGVHGYMEFLEAIDDPKHERHSELVEWIGSAFDPDDFDATTIAFDDPKKRWKIAFEDSGHVIPEVASRRVPGRVSSK